MTKLELQKIEATGETRYYVDFPRQVIGGYSNPREVSVIFEPPRKTVKPLLSLMELEISGENIALDRWRLWFNNIAIAREIKPVVNLRIRDHSFVKAVFDIAPLLDGREVDEYKFRIRYMHSAGVEVLKVGFLLIYEEPGSRTETEYRLSPIVLNGKEREIILESTILPPYTLHLTGLAPHGALSISCGNSIVTEEGLVDSKVECNSRKIVISASNTEPPALLSSLVMFRMERPEPTIEITVEKTDSGIEAIIENNGTATADNVIVLILAAGNVLYRSKHEKLLPMQKIQVKTGLPKTSHITIRVIVKYKGETKIYEKKMKIA